MRIDNILSSQPVDDFISSYRCIKQNCSQFIKEAGSLPLFKNLPCTYEDVHKVKVRQRKPHDIHFADTFNEAFDDEITGLRQRAVFATGRLIEEADINVEPFYIFPINKFKFMYSSEVENSSDDYKTVFESVFHQLGEAKGKEVISELLRFSYTHDNLREGLEQGSEIIIYNIPYFYAVRQNSISDYDNLLTCIEVCDYN